MKLFLLLCFLSTVVCKDEEKYVSKLDISSTLTKVAILFRHGDRSLHDVGGSGGSAQLTAEGMKRIFDLGHMIRKRYKNFLTDDASEVQAQTVALNRCITSLECLLTALYPPTNETRIEPGLEWQPIPIHMDPLIADSLLFAESYCPAADLVWPAIRKGPIVAQINEDNKEFFEFLSNKSGRVIKDFVSASHFQDDLLVMKIEKMPIDAWITDDVYNRMENFTDVLYTLRSMDTLQQRLRAGPFLEEVIQVLTKNEVEVINTGAQDDEDAAPHKLYIYATKRFNIGVVLQALDAFYNKSALAGSSIFFELHQLKNETFLRVFHMNETDTGNIFPLIVRGCTSVDCPWENFTQAIEPFIPEDFEKECTIVSDSDASSSSGTSVVLSGVFILVTFLAQMTILPTRNSSPASFLSL